MSRAPRAGRGPRGLATSPPRAPSTPGAAVPPGRSPGRSPGCSLGRPLAAALALATGCVVGADAPGEPDHGYRMGGKVDGAPAADLQTHLARDVAPWAAAHGVAGALAGAGGITLRTRSFERADARAEVVVLPGRTEAARGYDEVAYDLRDLPASIHVLDHRGQGDSDRLLPDPQKGHVVEFDDYVDDAEAYVAQVHAAHPERPLFVLAHSMGGGIATALAERGDQPIDGLVLVSPMEEVDTSPYWESVALAYAKGLVLTGHGDDYAPGMKPYDPAQPFATNVVTHSRDRFEMIRELVAARPGLALGGPTARWVEEAIEGSISARTFAYHLTVPTLMLEAGDDRVVRNGGADWVCDHAEDCARLRFDGAYHALLLERDGVRDEVLDAIYAFVGARL